MAKLLDGKKISEQIKKELALEVKKLKKKGITPGLAFFVVPGGASESYVRIKERVANELGIRTWNTNLEKPTTEKIIKIINKWNSDKKIHGIVVQLPLPKNVDMIKVVDSIKPEKDVDGLGTESIAALWSNEPGFVPATPLGVLTLLERYKISAASKHVVVVGRSLLVGKPLAQLLLNSDATVTVAHSKTKNLGAVTKTADILISAVGKPQLIKANMVKKGAIVIDVGITSVKGKLVGDVDFDGVLKVASYITPVPGGVGPMTVVALMQNLIEATKKS